MHDFEGGHSLVTKPPLPSLRIANLDTILPTLVLLTMKDCPYPHPITIIAVGGVRLSCTLPNHYACAWLIYTYQYFCSLDGALGQKAT